MGYWIRYDLYYTYKSKKLSGSGVAHGRCNLRFILKMYLKQAEAKLKREPLYMKNYTPNQNFDGWPKSYYGKRLTIEVAKLKITGFVFKKVEELESQ